MNNKKDKNNKPNHPKLTAFKIFFIKFSWLIEIILIFVLIFTLIFLKVRNVWDKLKIDVNVNTESTTDISSSESTTEFTTDEAITTEDNSYFKESDNVKFITEAEINKKIQNKETFLLAIGKPECPYCKEIFPYITEAVGDKTICYYLDTTIYNEGLNSEDKETATLWKEKMDNLKKTLNYEYIPIFKYYIDGVETYNLNAPFSKNPTDESLSVVEKKEILEEGRDKLESFINGCIGKGEIINEEPLKEEADTPNKVVTTELSEQQKKWLDEILASHPGELITDEEYNSVINNTYQSEK